MTAAALLAPWVALGLLLWPLSRRLGLAVAPWTALPALLLALAAGEVAAVRLGPLVFQADDLGRAFLLFSALIWWLAGLFAGSWMRGRPDRLPFTVVWLTTLGGSIALLLAENLLSFYVGFAIASLAAWGLVLAGDDVGRSRPAARIYLYLMAISEVALLTGIAAAATMDALAFASLTTTGTGNLALAAFALGFAIKLGVLGVHGWLPLAHAAAPVPASAVLSAVLIKAGLLGWLRVLPSDASTLEPWTFALALLGFAAVFYGALQGIRRDHPKEVLAFSTVSQVGLLLVAIALGMLDANFDGQLMAFLAGHHALAKAAAFLGLGMLATASGGLRIGVLLGLAAAGLVLIGAPLSSGAVAKSLLEAGLGSSGWPAAFAAALTLSATATTLLMLRFGVLALRYPSTRTPSPGLWLPWALLLLSMLLAPWWLPGARGLAPVSAAQIWPAVLALAMAIGVMRLSLPVVRPGGLLRALRARWPGVRPSRIVHMERWLLRWTSVGRMMLIMALAMLGLLFLDP
ncbi:MAG: hypothetical protein JJT88_16250 [Gammaproteobacteria bacterium]|nr:hypothetical protein [Gammaproteobacteria bacterium]